MEVSEIQVSYNLPKENRLKVTSSKSLYDLAIKHWNLNTIEMQEEMKVIFLNRNNIVIGVYRLSSGGIAGTIVDIRLLLSVALKCLASSFAMVHNHPSGNLKPSQPDCRITKRIKTACEFLDIALVDHLIISKYGYYSFADEGIL